MLLFVKVAGELKIQEVTDCHDAKSKKNVIIDVDYRRFLADWTMKNEFLNTYPDMYLSM